MTVIKFPNAAARRGQRGNQDKHHMIANVAEPQKERVERIRIEADDADRVRGRLDLDGEEIEPTDCPIAILNLAADNSEDFSGQLQFITSALAYALVLASGSDKSKVVVVARLLEQQLKSCREVWNVKLDPPPIASS